MVNPEGTVSKDILLTIDVEDWFQVENLKKHVHFSSWPRRKLRVERNTYRILDLLDSITVKTTSYSPQKATDSKPEAHCRPAPPVINVSSCCNHNPKATFFVLGWVAQRLPDLVCQIHARGHEVASHGFYHRLCQEESFQDLKEDLMNSRKLLEDIVGAQIFGYRAPSFSINDEILKIIEDCGYLYDSSYNSFRMHGRYGAMNLSRHDRNGIAYQVSDGLLELPISNITIKKHTLPWGGGGYLRLIPFSIFKKGIRRILKKEGAYLFYIHPWEIDPEQPKVAVSSLCEARHYVNLSRTQGKLSKLIRTFDACRFSTCLQYIKRADP